MASTWLSGPPSRLPELALLWLLLPGCSDTPVPGPADTAASDIAGRVFSGSDIVWQEGSETASDANAAADPDATAGTDTASDAATAQDTVPVPDTAADAAAPDTAAVPDTAADATAPDTVAAPDSAADTPALPACPSCTWNLQPPAPHPGAAGPHSTVASTLEYGSGFGSGYKQMAVVKPNVAGIHPVLFFVPARGLATGGGLQQKVGHPYFELLEHVASHGYVAVLVAVEANAFDADQPRMADDLLAATQSLFAQVSTADPQKVAFAGHGLGAKVALWATWKTLNLDMKGEFADPVAVVSMGLANEPPALGTFHDVVPKVAQLLANEPTWFTFLQAHDDAAAPYLDPKKPNALAVYAALKTEKRQVIVLRGTGKGDPNPPLEPELHDDASAPLTVEGKPGSIVDFSIPDSHLDGLDWYGTWKVLVGALNHHFQGGDATWAYGPMRTHGGNAPAGGTVTHEVYAQGW